MTQLRAFFVVGSILLTYGGCTSDVSLSAPENLGSSGGEASDDIGAGGDVSDHMVAPNLCEGVICPEGGECVADADKASCICGGKECSDTYNCDSEFCHEFAECEELSDGFSCTCQDGYAGNGFSCSEVDLCETITCKGSNTECRTDGVSAACVCRSGFELGTTQDCFDVDECRKDDACGANAQCLNRIGSYLCDCLPGYEVSKDGACQPSAQCAGSSACIDLGTTCLGIEGEVSCTCSEGEFGDGTFCRSTSSCAASPCVNESECIEQQSGFACVCAFGTSGSNCADTASCASGLELNQIFSDPTLLRVLEDLAEPPSGVNPTLADLSSVVSLNLDSIDLLMGESRVANLDGLECLPQLRDISITDQQISDITPLAHLQALENIDLSCNPIADLTPLARKSFLEVLSLGYDDSCAQPNIFLTDPSQVSSLLNLRSLNVSQRGIVNDPSFDSLVFLEELSISGNALDVFTELGTMPSLRVLYASNTSTVSLVNFSRFPLLRELELNNTKITSLAGLQEAQQLRRLYLIESDLSSLAGIDKSPLLREFAATESNIGSLSGLASASSLVETYLTDNTVIGLDSLLDADDLLFSGEIFLRDNPIDCPSFSLLEASLNERNIHAIVDCP